MKKREAYEAEIARLESLADSAQEFEGAARVEGRVADERATFFTLRISAQTLTEITEAAAAKGQTISEFICAAAIESARSNQVPQTRHDTVSGARRSRRVAS